MSDGSRSLAGRRALVVGASGGIGGAVSRGLVRSGAIDVTLVGRSAEKLETLADLLRAEGARVATLAGDLGEQRFLDRVAAEADPVDVLVQAAGIAVPAPFLETDPVSLETMLRINIWAVFTLTQAVARSMAARRTGDIVVIGSGLARAASPNTAGYGLTKHALVGFVRSIRQDLAPLGVRVIEIAPGYVGDTEFHRHATHPSLQGCFSERPYVPIQAEDVAACVVTALSLPQNAEVTTLEVRSRGHFYVG